MFNAVYGMQADELFYALETAIYDKKAIIMTSGTVLPRELYDSNMMSDILSCMKILGVNQSFQICSYTENAVLQTQYNQQQQKIIDDTEAEYLSLSKALGNIEAQIEKIETDLLK